jgi:hypothetical protein
VALAAPVSTKKLSLPPISPEQAGTPRISGKGRNACPDRLTNDLPALPLWVVAFQIFDTFAARVRHATLANLSLTSRFLKPELCTGRVPAPDWRASGHRVTPGSIVPGILIF